MPGMTFDVNLQTPSSRSRLPKKVEPHWTTLIYNRAALGWQNGRWLLGRYRDGKYSREFLGKVEDGSREANGDTVLYFIQAKAMAEEMLGKTIQPSKRLTVRQAMAMYEEFLRTDGKFTGDLISRTKAWINPLLG